MDETIKALNDHIEEIDSQLARIQRYSTAKAGDDQAAYLQAKSTALLAKIIAAGIKEAANE